MLHRTLLFLCACLCACAAPPDDTAPDLPHTDEIIHGTRDYDRHPGVLALFTTDGSLCTATLIAPRLVLTARHCVSRTTPTLRCPSTDRQVLATRDPEEIDVLLGETTLVARDGRHGVASFVPPGDNLCDADVAVVALDRAITSIAPLRVARTNDTREGSAVTLVGFGARGDSTRAGVGARYFRNGVRVLADTPTELLIGRGACEGDSGGPALDPRTGAVVGVLSRGSDRCNTPDARSVFTRASVALPLVERATAQVR